MVRTNDHIDVQKNSFPKIRVAVKSLLLCYLTPSGAGRAPSGVPEGGKGVLPVSAAKTFLANYIFKGELKDESI